MGRVSGPSTTQQVPCFLREALAGQQSFTSGLIFRFYFSASPQLAAVVEEETTWMFIPRLSNHALALISFTAGGRPPAAAAGNT